ncbi:MAG: hypothetical protein ACREFQ_13815 [Stellaceae bacterium]
MSTTRRTAEVLRSAELVKGQWYLGFDCHACRRKLAIDAAASSLGMENPESSNKGSVTVQCPHCGSRDDYQWTEHIRFSAK